MFDFIEATNSAKTPEEVFSLFLEAVERLGFDRVMYSMLTKNETAAKSTPPAAAIMRNYPDDWVAHYVEAGYVDSDPVRRLARRMRGPFTWRQTIESGHFSKRELRVFAEATAAGLHDGVAIPFHGPNGEIMGVGLASSVGGVDAGRQLNRINILGVQFHLAYSSLAFPVQVSTHIRLSPREHEILSWCLAGKTTWAISQILNSAEKTVEWHLTRIYLKLGVSTRIEAVVKALNLGLISQ